ncbi:VOC family protein [Mariniradius saccharolyticus]|nr:VOC family protein [Mariniradius saccharolyticus]
MAIVNIYLTFNGNCKEAFEFYASVLQQKISDFNLFGEMPPQPGFELSEADKNRVMHVTLPISKETSLMGSDTFPHQPVSFGDNFSISISPDSKKEADRIFKELGEAGNVVMPMADTFWNAYFGMVKDKFGVNWMINFDSSHS